MVSRTPLILPARTMTVPLHYQKLQVKMQMSKQNTHGEAEVDGGIEQRTLSSAHRAEISMATASVEPNPP